jgi:putative peptide zinc metalloprotease protein
MVPRGGATQAHPAVYFIPGTDGSTPVAIVATTSGSSAQRRVAATVFPFTLPDKPKPGDLQALATGTRDGGVTYDVVYSLVTVQGGAPVTNENSAYALASCTACTTVAVSFQVVLVVGTSKTIAPVNVAEALNNDCPSCLTAAIADQIVVTLTSQPTDELVAKIQAALQQLDAIKALGANATPAAIAAQVAQVQQQIDDALQASGQLSNTTTTTSTTTTATTPQAATTTTATTPTTTATTTADVTTTGPATTTSTARTTTAETTTTAKTTPDQTTTTTPTTTTTGATTTTTTTSG